ncbi:MAG: ankyrin repeat domain-containing protein [Deltaproteobacteria bacterium]|nr:ankyrin repeat domain-containing protein [Deltaproteobacteria bacterium]
MTFLPRTLLLALAFLSLSLMLPAYLLCQEDKLPAFNSVPEEGATSSEDGTLDDAGNLLVPDPQDLGLPQDTIIVDLPMEPEDPEGQVPTLPDPAPTTGPEWLEYCRLAPSTLLVKAIVDGGSDASYADEDGFTTLMAAASSNSDPAAISVLVANGADIKAKEKRFGFDALKFAAAFNPHPLVVEVLLNQGADPNELDNGGGTALTLAATMNFNPQIVASLLNAGCDINSKDAQGNTPLMGAAGYNKNFLVLAKLINDGADVNSENELGNTPLFFAALSNPNPDILRELIKAGADPNHKNARGETALFYAVQNPSLEVLKQLLNAKADPLAKDETDTGILFAAALTSSNPLVLAELLTTGLDINALNSAGLSPLMAAAGNPHPEIARYLVVQGAKVDAVDDNGRSALLLAAWLNPEPKVIRTLLFAGGDPNIKDKEGNDLKAMAAKNLNPSSLVIVEHFLSLSQADTKS